MRFLFLVLVCLLGFSIAQAVSVGLELQLGPNILLNRQAPSHLEIVQDRSVQRVQKFSGHVYTKDKHYFDQLDFIKMQLLPDQEVLVTGQVFLCDAIKHVCFVRKINKKLVAGQKWVIKFN